GLQHGSHLGIAEPNPERGRSHNDFLVRVDTGILSTGTTNPYSRSQYKDVSDFLHESPVLSSVETFACIGKRRRAEVRQGPTRAPKVRSTEAVPPLSVQQVVVQPVDDVEVIGESKDTTPEVRLRTSRGENAPQQ